MTSRRSSGSRRAESAVEPTRSQNITVSWRRSAEGLRADGQADGSTTHGAAGVDPRALAVSVAPQSPQNLLPDGFSAPHAAQRTGSATPQSPQNFFPSGLALPQLGHSMPHLVARRWSAYHKTGRCSSRFGSTLLSAVSERLRDSAASR